MMRIRAPITPTPGASVPPKRTRGTLAYWRLSGDRDAREMALAVADSAVRTRRGIGSTSVRDHAGILYCLMAAYDETHDPKYLQAARELVHDALSRIDARRGCYAEAHGNASYQGNVPWLCAQGVSGCELMEKGVPLWTS